MIDLKDVKMMMMLTTMMMTVMVVVVAAEPDGLFVMMIDSVDVQVYHE